MHYLLLYEFGTDYLERRANFRSEHLRLAWEASDRGELVLAGALADPVDSGVLLFNASGPEPVEAFALADPYVRHGLVKRWQVRPWTTVVGREASQPVR
jgi:uncharacterized protein YciI